MIKRMGFRKRRQPVVNGMGRRQSRTFKADAGKQDIGLNNMIQGRCNKVLRNGDFRGGTIRQQGVITEPGQMKPRQGAVTAALI